MEEKVIIESGELKLEGLLNRTSPERAVVVTHPHPLYGGEMHNPVVETTAQVYGQKGYTALRFNFRGAGDSQGRYDDGLGEQQDVHAALSFLSNMGFNEIDLAGYSFGAWVNAHLDPGGASYARMVMVSPPVAFMDFSNVPALARLTLVVAGSNDDIAPPDQIRQHLPLWNQQARFETVKGADHFYSGTIHSLAAVLAEYL
jgi:alpha/beta superfamily hydrolase